MRNTLNKNTEVKGVSKQSQLCKMGFRFTWYSMFIWYDTFRGVYYLVGSRYLLQGLLLIEIKKPCIRKFKNVQFTASPENIGIFCTKFVFNLTVLMSLIKQYASFYFTLSLQFH